MEKKRVKTFSDRLSLFMKLQFNDMCIKFWIPYVGLLLETFVILHYVTQPFSGIDNSFTAMVYSPTSWLRVF